jgi:NAD(P)H dehydrogenase (quinone)
VGKILVTGASGAIGKKTLEHLLKRQPVDELVGMVRDVAKAQDLAEKGIELRQGDYLDSASLNRAFVGVEKLMLVSAQAFTDRNTAHANVVDAAVKAGVKHIVYMPVQRKPNSNFVLKEITNEDIFAVDRILSSGIPYTFVRHPVFLDFISTYIGKSAHKSGVYVTAGDSKFSPAMRDDLSEAHAVVLSEAGHENKTYTLSGTPAVSFSDIASILTEATGTKVPYVTVSAEEYVKIRIADGWPPFVAEFAVGWVQALAGGEFSEHTDDLERLIGRKPITAAQFLQNDYITGELEAH